MTQRQQVLRAVTLGAETSYEVVAVTGLPLKTCSAYLSAAVKDGILKRVPGADRTFSKTRRGNYCHVYRPVRSAEDAT